VGVVIRDRYLASSKGLVISFAADDISRAKMGWTGKPGILCEYSRGAAEFENRRNRLFKLGPLLLLSPSQNTQQLVRLHPQMNPPEFADPPTRDSLATARRSLDATHVDMRALTDKIDVAEATLAKIVRESRFAIEEMFREKRMLEYRARHTLAYLSPMRRLPLELLREIFLWCFQSHPCSAWVLASVCPSWRRLALRIPVIWSKVNFFFHTWYDQPRPSPWLFWHGLTWPLAGSIFLTQRVLSLITRPLPPSVCARRHYLYPPSSSTNLALRFASLRPNMRQQIPSGYGSSAPEIRFLLISKYSCELLDQNFLLWTFHPQKGCVGETPRV
jgi:hypothetical protein